MNISLTHLIRLICATVFMVLLVIILESSLDLTMAALTGASHEYINSYRWMAEALARARMSSTTPPLSTTVSMSPSMSTSEVVATSTASTISFTMAAVYLSCTMIVLISRYYW